jgi:hypothetical protein
MSEEKLYRDILMERVLTHIELLQRDSEARGLPKMYNGLCPKGTQWQSLATIGIKGVTCPISIATPAKKMFTILCTDENMSDFINDVISNHKIKVHGVSGQEHPLQDCMRDCIETQSRLETQSSRETQSRLETQSRANLIITRYHSEVPPRIVIFIHLFAWHLAIYTYENTRTSFDVGLLLSIIAGMEIFSDRAREIISRLKTVQPAVQPAVLPAPLSAALPAVLPAPLSAALPAVQAAPQPAPQPDYEYLISKFKNV